MKTITGLFLILISQAAFAAGWEGLIQNLTQTRAEVETLSRETDSLQKEKQADLDQWTGRKTDLETQVQREKLRELQLAEKIKRVDSRVRIQTKTDPNAQKKLLTWIEKVDTWVRQSLPFQQNERLRSLSTLKERATRGHESLEFVMADLWSFMESEIKLSQTNEFTIMDITLDAKPRKVEIARLGMQSLYALTTEGKTYQAKRSKNDWTWEPVASAEEETSIQLLIKNLKSKNYSGYYYLPVNKQQEMGASL